jgi:hypothetical protein
LRNGVHSSAAGIEPLEQAFRAVLAAGIPPERVADAVVDAIRRERFYVITQNETEARIRARFDRILKDAVMSLAS